MKRYRVNSFVPPKFVGLDRIYFVEERGLLGTWHEVPDIRGKTAAEAEAELRRRLMTEAPIEFAA